MVFGDGLTVFGNKSVSWIVHQEKGITFSLDNTRIYSMPAEVETVFHLATPRRYVLGAVSVRHMIEQEVWLEPSMASL